MIFSDDRNAAVMVTFGHAIHEAEGWFAPFCLGCWQRIANYYNGDLTGQCYAVSEAVYHMCGGKEMGLTPVVIQHEGGSHWYLRTVMGGYIDITESQFSTPVPHEKGRGCGFLTKQPSRRAQALIDHLTSTP